MSKKKSPGIYKITNIVTGKCYVGSTSRDVFVRLSEHKWDLKNNAHQNRYLQASFNKHGILNFRFEAVEIIDDVEESLGKDFLKQFLLKMENYYCLLYNSFIEDNGYNIRPTCETNKGILHSEETKKKISSSNKGKKRTPEQVQRMKEVALKRGPHSIEWKKKMSEKNKGENNPNFGKKHKKSPECIERMREKSLLFKHSEEDKKKMSEIKKEYWKRRKENESTRCTEQ